MLSPEKFSRNFRQLFWCTKCLGEATSRDTHPAIVYRIVAYLFEDGTPAAAIGPECFATCAAAVFHYFIHGTSNPLNFWATRGSQGSIHPVSPPAPCLSVVCFFSRIWIQHPSCGSLILVGCFVLFFLAFSRFPRQKKTTTKKCVFNSRDSTHRTSPSAGMMGVAR